MGGSQRGNLKSAIKLLFAAFPDGPVLRGRRRPPCLVFFILPRETIRYYFFFLDFGLEDFSTSALNSVLIDPIFATPAFALSSAPE